MRASVGGRCACASSERAKTKKRQWRSKETEKHLCGAFRGMKSGLDNSMKACGGQVDNAEVIRTKNFAVSRLSTEHQ